MVDRETIRRLVAKVIRWAVTDTPLNDKGDYPVAQVSFKRRPGDSVQISPWGFHSSPPSDELAALMTIDGAPDARAHIVASGAKRPRLASGEVVIWRPDGSKIHLLKDGDIVIEAKDQARIVAPGGLTIDADVQINGAVATSSTVRVGTDLTVVGNTDLGDGAATVVTIGGTTAPTAGVINVFSPWGNNVAGDSSATAGVVDLATHKHRHVEDGTNQETNEPQDGP